MTDPTKKDESGQTNDKAKAVKSAMTGTPETGAATPPADKPADPVKEPPKTGAPEGSVSKPVAASAAKPPEPPKDAAREPAKDPMKPASPSPTSPPRDPSKGSVPPSSPAPSASAGTPGAAAGGKEPPKAPSGPQGPGAPKGPGSPPSGAAAKSPPPRTPAAKPKKKRGCLGMLIWLLVIVGALGAAAYYTWPHWPAMVKKPVEAKISELVPDVQTPAEKAAIEDRLAKYDAQIAALENTVAQLSSREVLTADQIKSIAASGGGAAAGAGADAAKVNALAARVDALEKALTSVGSSQTTGTGDVTDATDAAAGAAVARATAAIGASVETLSQRVAQLETEIAAVTAVESRVKDMEARAQEVSPREAKAALVLAVSHLSDAVTRSVPFTDELNSLKAVAKDDAGFAEPIGVLESQAKTGIPSLIDLRASFPEVARDVSRVHADWTGEDWVDKALTRVTSLVSVRKTGTDAMADLGTDGALAKAEGALENGDVAAAVKALEGLEGPPAEAAAPWLAEARKRLSALEALASLRQRAIALLAAGG